MQLPKELGPVSEKNAKPKKTKKKHLDPCSNCNIGIAECREWIANPAVRQHCCNVCKREPTHSEPVLA